MNGHFIRNISMENLISIDRLELHNCHRVNVFIGENSSGKSNILRGIIGYLKGDFPKRKQYISFYDESHIETPLNQNEIVHPFFEIPPFRMLVLQNQYPVSHGNPKSGILDLSKIEGIEKEFYPPLENIIGIKGFRLKEGRHIDFPKCLIREAEENGVKKKYINLEQWTDWGRYEFMQEGQRKESNIDYLGWGTKSTVIIYYNLYFKSKSIALIEEPEISTHPGLLKNLLDWAFKYRPEVQFFITTHSSFLIDKIFTGLPENHLKIFKVYKDYKGHTKAEALETRVESFRVLEQLGFKSSNLLFVNYLIWVEGPSDIFYFEAFLNLENFLKGSPVEKCIKRGTHYEIMWYGGREEGHLFDIESEDELSIFFSFNREGAIFWDSDGARKLRPMHKRIVTKTHAINRDLGRVRFLVGCTGEILSEVSPNEYKKNSPRTIENLMCKLIAQIALSKTHPAKGGIRVIAERVGKNQKIRKKDNVDKIRLGKEFLTIVNEAIKNDDRDMLTNIFSHHNEMGWQIRTFFETLYERIRSANSL
jgi:AAA15 family ATPase/GTPase